MKSSVYENNPSPIFQSNEIVVEPPRGWLALRLKDIWAFRELLFFFVWSDIKVRYKQTVLGISWAILHPFMTMVIFSIIFGRLVNVPSDGVPYPIFSNAGLQRTASPRYSDTA